MFEITFLGTSSGVPTRHRNVSAMAVSLLGLDKRVGKNTPWILVDCGEGTQHQLMKTTHRPNQLRAIFITHAHGDHCYGLAGLLASLAMHGRSQSLPLIAPQAVLELVQAHIRLTEMNINYPLEMIAVEQLLQSGSEFTLNLAPHWTLSVSITPLSHRCDSFAFGFVQRFWRYRLNIEQLERQGVERRLWARILQAANLNEPLPPFGEHLSEMIKNGWLRVQHQQQKIIIAGDNDTPDLLAAAVYDAALLVHEATYTQAIMEKILSKNAFNPQHSSALQVATFAQQAALPALALTHFSARFLPFDDVNSTQPNMGHIRCEAQSVYRGKLILAQDFLVVNTTDLPMMQAVN